MWLVRGALRNHYAVSVFALLLLVLGVVALAMIPVDKCEKHAQPEQHHHDESGGHSCQPNAGYVSEQRPRAGDVRIHPRHDNERPEGTEREHNGNGHHRTWWSIAGSPGGERDHGERDGGGDQLAGAARARLERIATFGVDERLPARPGHLDHRPAPVEPPRGVDGVAERPGQPLGIGVVERERIEREVVGSERERGVWRRYRLLPTPIWSLVGGAVGVRFVLLAGAGALQLLLALALGTPRAAHPQDLLVAFAVVSFTFCSFGLIVAITTAAELML